MANEIRQHRVAALLFEELSTLIGGELNDPQLSLVSVTDVIVSKDLRNVKVYVNHPQDEGSPRSIVGRLQKAVPFLRSKIAEHLALRVVPDMTFHYDASPQKASRLEELFRQLAAERAEQASSDASVPPASAQ